MNPREFQKLAQRLTELGGPADLRSAISRAYYAAFNMAVELMETIVPLSVGPGAHGQVQRILANCSNTELLKAARMLRDLHQLRIGADYKMRNADCENPKTAQANVTSAEDVIGTLDRTFASNDAKSLKKSIQHYWTQILREPLKDRFVDP